MGQPAAPWCIRSRADGYARRQPERTVLYRTLSAYWPAFVERAEEAGGLPVFVRHEVEEYLRCGLIEHGCALLVCEGCGTSLLVAFSCRRRGFCPSCCGRRMNDAALHLTERVLPEVAVRQWVCSLPWQLRYVLGYDRKLCAQVLGAFVHELSRSYRHRAKREHALASMSALYTGQVTFVQRVDSALRLNVHAHAIALDGVYQRDQHGDELRFLPLPEPTEQDVQQLAERTAARIERVLHKAGRYLDAQDADHDEPDPLALTEPALSACYQAAASGRPLFAQAPGKPALRLMRGSAARPQRAVALCAQARGVNIHASLAVPGTDRRRIKRLCRYAARPPLAQKRLHQLPDGRLRLELKKPWADGTTAFVFQPLEFIARLVAAIPPPRFHMTRFHGVLASHSTLRPLVVPTPKLATREAAQVQPAALQLPLFADTSAATAAQSPAPLDTLRTQSPYKGRHLWALLLRHVFAVDAMRCVHCQGRMRLRLLCTTPDAIARAIAHEHAGPGPPRAPPSPRPAHSSQVSLPFG